MLRRIADFNNPRSLAGRMRARRFAFFRSLLRQLPKPLRILDVGGTPAFWRHTGLLADGGVTVTLFNLNTYDTDGADVAQIVGDARDLSCFPSNAFNIAFSNSLIEHVGGFADQARMAAEVRRVAPRYFVQTPNRYFPMEPHFLLPGFQFYPRSLRVGLVQRYQLGWMPQHTDRAAAEREVDGIRLLNATELRTIFPGCQLYRERLGGLTKSLIAHAGW